MKNLDFIYKRHSVRSFTGEDVPIEDIKEILKAGTHAPSGKNRQNWHFVVVRNKKKIQEMARIVERKNREIAALTADEDKRKTMTKFLKYHTFFKDAPVVILVYTAPYPLTEQAIYEEIGASQEIINSVALPSPGIQNIGAAMENLQLAATHLGYGTCWMTGPNYASKEISDYLDFHKDGFFLAAMTPLGIPISSDVKSPPRNPLDETMTIID